MRTADEVLVTPANGERRVRVFGDRVACRRIGPTDFRRCAECVYLLRLRRGYVVCLEGEIPSQPHFVW